VGEGLAEAAHRGGGGALDAVKAVDVVPGLGRGDDLVSGGAAGEGLDQVGVRHVAVAEAVVAKADGVEAAGRVEPVGLLVGPTGSASVQASAQKA